MFVDRKNTLDSNNFYSRLHYNGHFVDPKSGTKVAFYSLETGNKVILHRQHRGIFKKFVSCSPTFSSQQSGHS